MKIHLHIERLVLDGLPLTSAEGPQLQRAVERELARLLAPHGLSHELRQGAAVPRVRAGSVQLAKAQQPSALGQGIARAIHEGIGNSPRGGNPR